MAITKTTTVERIDIYASALGAPGGSPSFPVSASVTYLDVYDDVADNDLPAEKRHKKHFNVGDDLTGQDQWVQDVLNAAFNL